MQASNVNNDEEHPAFNTVDEVAKELRANRKSVYDAIARNEIPAVRIGRAIRIPSAWLRRVSA
jgi:excisionase family DNA binding protein